MQPLVLTPTDFIATTNQILETSYGFFYVEGELSQFRISKGKWVYFDVIDEHAKVSFFGSVYMLPGPLTDGMIVRVGGTAKLHPQYGFSVTAQSIQPTGQGSITQAVALLAAKLQKEGLFATERKRLLPTIPTTVALVASVESAAYADFIKVTTARWPFANIEVYDTLVQGENAPDSLVRAVHAANTAPILADVLVMTRGGGSADDLAAFNDERVVRALSASRIPTMVAIGHEVDESLAELVADRRASTPSNAAELLFPDKAHELATVQAVRRSLASSASSFTAVEHSALRMQQQRLQRASETLLHAHQTMLAQQRQLLSSYNPSNVLARGYAIVQSGAAVVQSAHLAVTKKQVHITFHDGTVAASVQKLIDNKE
ncbi:MAG TPA: exodeoxyribonuclease VII large subunit [Candidatus Saccharibacteria bacterium]|nr:exodeoxyribonuclease VII large subunit [Candidatus Saccharibacteria bacterium]